MPTERSPAEAAFDQGMALARQGALDAAAAAFAEAARLQPLYAEAHNNLGIVWAQLGRFADAASAFGTVVALRPEIAAVHGSLGNALAQLDQPEEALAAFERAAALDPGWASRCKPWQRSMRPWRWHRPMRKRTSIAALPCVIWAIRRRPKPRSNARSRWHQDWSRPMSRWATLFLRKDWVLRPWRKPRRP